MTLLFYRFIYFRTPVHQEYLFVPLCLSNSHYGHIWRVLKTVLASASTIRPSKMEWKDLWESGMKRWNSTRSPKVNEIKSFKLSRIKIRCSLASPKILARAMKSIRSIGSGQRLPRSSATLASTIPVIIRTPIPHYPEIATEIYIDGLLGVSRRIDWIM